MGLRVTKQTQSATVVNLFFKKVSKQVNNAVRVPCWNTHVKEFPTRRKSTFLPPRACLALLFVALRQQQNPPTPLIYN